MSLPYLYSQESDGLFLPNPSQVSGGQCPRPVSLRCENVYNRNKQFLGGLVMLKGNLVLDLSTLLPGPYATTRLAELGATVWKVEPPGGDPARFAWPQQDGVGLVYQVYISGKQVFHIDLKTKAGRLQLYHMAKDADVLLHGFRPGVAERLDIGYDRLREINPRLIYCALTGYGQVGPWARYAGHDINYMAVSGMLSQHHDINGHPIMPTVQWADYLGGQAVVEAILAALVARQRSGQGTFLDVSMTGALRRLLMMHDAIDSTAQLTNGVPELTGQSVSYHLYETQDGRWIALGALEFKFWEAFCREVGREGWVAHHHSAATSDNPVFRELIDLFRSRPLVDWTDLGRRVDCCLTPVLTLREARQYLQQV